MDRVEEWLLAVGLNQYTQNFEATGYDELDLLCNLTSAELEDLAAAVELLPGHALKLKRRLHSNPPRSTDATATSTVGATSLDDAWATPAPASRGGGRVVKSRELAPVSGGGGGSGRTGGRVISVRSASESGGHDIIPISVGGTNFGASRSTWTRFSGTLLAAMVGEKWSLQESCGTGRAAFHRTVREAQHSSRGAGRCGGGGGMGMHSAAAARGAGTGCSSTARMQDASAPASPPCM